VGYLAIIAAIVLGIVAALLSAMTFLRLLIALAFRDAASPRRRPIAS
jgi:hypothetical protein